MAFTPFISVNVPVVSVAPFIGLLKVAVIFRLMGTAVAPLAGFVELTVGGRRLTVNTCAEVALPELVTMTFWGPSAAFAAIANVAVICVLLTTVVLLTVIPAPLNPTVA